MFVLGLIPWMLILHKIFCFIRETIQRFKWTLYKEFFIFKFFRLVTMAIVVNWIPIAYFISVEKDGCTLIDVVFTIRVVLTSTNWWDMSLCKLPCKILPLTFLTHWSNSETKRKFYPLFTHKCIEYNRYITVSKRERCLSSIEESNHV